MSDFKEFTGKSIDDAIEQACKHFNVSRNKLEIEILTGGSTGIFGLVGVKKATVRARLRQPDAAQPREEAETRAKKPAEEKPEKAVEQAPREEAREKPREQAPKAAGEAPEVRERPGKGRGRGRTKPPRPGQQPRKEPDERGAPRQAAKPENQKPPQRDGGRRRGGRRKPGRREFGAGESRNHGPGPENNNRPKARPKPNEQQYEPPKDATEARETKPFVLEVVKMLVEPIVADAKLTAEVEPGRVKVRVEDDEDIGLIIGAEGQTISALQYLANRIVARKAKGNVRVHLDAGDYRERQDDSLRQLAWTLADRAKEQGKTQATRPLSSYHRRVVHLALQEDESVQTRSKGDGPLKRVLILPKRG